MLDELLDRTSKVKHNKQIRRQHMKKQIITIALISGLALAGTASANWGRGTMGGGMNCGQLQGQFTQLDQATQDKIKKFFNDNQELRKKLVMKRAEKRALMQSATPDPKMVAAVTGELFDLRTTMRAHAVTAGVDKYLGPGRMGAGSMGCNGPGNGHGRGHGKGYGQGYGMNNNWNQ
jgi:Spy/CpxP family protein refolding chaperone